MNLDYHSSMSCPSGVAHLLMIINANFSATHLVNIVPTLTLFSLGLIFGIVLKIFNLFV